MLAKKQYSYRRIILIAAMCEVNVAVVELFYIYFLLLRLSVIVLEVYLFYKQVIRKCDLLFVSYL